jgi:cell division protein FtsB
MSNDNLTELTEALSQALVQRGELQVQNTLLRNRVALLESHLAEYDKSAVAVQAEVARLRDTETTLRQVNAAYHAEVVDLKAEAAKLRAALEAIEWICFSDDKWICPWCSALDRVGHHADCARQVALGL